MRCAWIRIKEVWGLNIYDSTGKKLWWSIKTKEICCGNKVLKNVKKEGIHMHGGLM